MEIVSQAQYLYSKAALIKGVTIIAHSMIIFSFVQR